MNTQTMTQPHIPVLPAETVEAVMPWTSGLRRVIDGTVGSGGHTALILRKNPDSEVLGIDRDEKILDFAREHLTAAGDRVRLVHGKFSKILEIAHNAGWEKVDSILLDIGVSSLQIDTPERGFSFRSGAPLDMRMDRSEKRTAADLLNSASQNELARIFRDYGEIREAGRLAAAIVREREKTPLETCDQLAEICEKTLLPRFRRKHAPPAPTLPFQALRIEINRELEELEKVLPDALNLLNPGGRLTVISFHSLEDRIVKRFFQDMAAECHCPPGLPVCICGWKRKLKILTKKPVTAAPEEMEQNPRSACARLRSAERVAEQVADEEYGIGENGAGSVKTIKK